MNKVLITGGSGFIGTNLVNYLVSKNYNVLNIDKINYSSTPEKFKIIKKKNNYEFKKLNLEDKKNLKKIIIEFNPQFIINLAAESHVDRSIDEPCNFIINNINSTMSLFFVVNQINKKIKKKISILHISTDEVYGSKKKGTFRETDNINPSSPYSSSKASCDLIALSFIKTFKLKLSIIRLCNNYGPYQYIEKFIPLAINKLKKKQKVPIYGNGNHIREWIFVEDSCNAIERFLKNFSPGKIYNLGSSIRFKNKEIINKIIKLMNLNKNLITHVTDRPGHDLRYAICSQKFQKELNWKCKTNIDKGLLRTLRWYENNKLWIKNAENNYNYKRLGKI